MNLRVGPYLYRVRFVTGYIQHDGDACLGLCDNECHELLISDRVSPAQQIQVVGHEYMEAWVYHFGQNLADKEDWCDLFGLALSQFAQDFVHQLREDAASHETPATPPARQTSTATAADPPRPADDPLARAPARQHHLPPTAPGDPAWRVRVFEPPRAAPS